MTARPFGDVFTLSRPLPSSLPLSGPWPHTSSRARFPSRPGALLLAAAAARPIVCMTVLGARACMPVGSPVVRHGHVRVVFSRPIPSADASVEQLSAAVVETFRSTLEHGGQD